MTRRWLLALLLAACTGCAHPAPQATPPPPPGIPGPAPAVPGTIGGHPFIARSVILWNDADAAWIAFRPDVPTTDGRFDPRARAAPAEGFAIRVDTEKLAPGRWTVTPATVGKVPGCPVVGASLMLLPSPRVVDDGWSLALEISRVVRRLPRRGSFPGFDLAGRVDLRFAHPPATLAGAFVAHDILRADEVAPDQPAVAEPAISPGRTAKKSAAPPRPTPPSR